MENTFEYRNSLCKIEVMNNSIPTNLDIPNRIGNTGVIRLIMKLRNMGIMDTNVLSAMEKIPRDIFVPEIFRDQAYEDIALPIGYGQTISQPYVVAVMTQELKLNDRDIVLEIGTGCGYQTGILSKLCRRVYTIERYRPLYDMSQANFSALGLRNITAICGDGSDGWKGNLKFSKIIVTAAFFGKTPQALLDQLEIGGEMIIPVGDESSQKLKKYHKISEDTFSVIDTIDVKFVPLLKGIATPTEYNNAHH